MGFIARSAARSTGKAAGSLFQAAFCLALVMMAADFILHALIIIAPVIIIVCLVILAWRRWHRPVAAPAAPTAVQVAQRNLAQARREETAAWAELARLEGRPLSSYTAQRNAARARAMHSNQAAVSDRR